jgi:ABC-type Fe3+-hydroxamate transport system substrate-binding protein
MRLILFSFFFCFLGLSSSLLACERIVSLAPSASQIAVGLGLKGNIVGVSRYDKLLEEGEGLESIGGFLDISLEHLVRLKPDLVIALSDHAQYLEKFQRLGLEVLVLEHKNYEGILSSLNELALKCSQFDSGLPAKAQSLKTLLKNDLRNITRLYSQKRNIPFLLVVASAGSFYLSGQDGFYSDLLELVSARNIYRGKTRSFSNLSFESLLRMKPEVIIVLGSSTDLERFRTLYMSLYRHKKVRFQNFCEKSFLIPGTHFTETLRSLATFIHDNKGIEAGMSGERC